ncbi:MAG: pentapeptide repeat-containing protein [Myxococcota bacterium]
MSLDEFTACPHCGTEMYLGAHFCVRCGSALAAPSDQARPSKPDAVLELTEFESWLPSPLPPSKRGKVKPDSLAALGAALPTAVEPMPMQAALVEVLAVEAAPVEALRAEAAPVEALAAEPAPIEVLAAEPAPVEVLAAEPTPVELHAIEVIAMDPKADALSIEDVDRGFDFPEEKTAISAGLSSLAAFGRSMREHSRQTKSELTREEVVRRLEANESFKRAGLAGLDLSGLNLEGVDLTRADLDGAKLDRAKLRGAFLQNASLRGASLTSADLSEAHLERADLANANLSSARLDGAELKRANLEKADLSGASLCGAYLVGAELLGATLVCAKLRAADLTDADLEGADLAMADLSEADLENTSLTLTNLVGVNLRAATLVDANLTRVNATRADFSHASLVRAKLTAASLQYACLLACDASGADFSGADLSGTIFDEARLHNANFEAAKVSSPPRLAGLELIKPANTEKRRYFGRGDLLRDARLNFGPGSQIHVESRFENCVIELGDGAELVIGEFGVLRDCQISGHGDIVVHGCFFERQSPGISGVRSLVVSAKGAVAAALQQVNQPTAFAFEAGCRLRIKITQSHEALAAE